MNATKLRIPVKYLGIWRFFSLAVGVELLLRPAAGAQTVQESSNTSVIVLRDVRTLTDVFIAEEAWMGGHFPGCKVLGVTSPSRTATNNLDVIAFELNGRKDKVAFKYPGITNCTIESLWEPYIAQLAHSGHPVIAAQFFRLRGHIMKMPINVTVPYLVKQLADKRPVFLLFASERTPNMRACDLVACFLLKELRSSVSHQTVLPNLPCDPYSTQRDGEGKPTDAAISQVLIWWNEQGRSLLERGQLCLPN